MSWLLLISGIVRVARFGLGKRLIPTVAGQPISGPIAGLLLGGLTMNARIIMART